MPLRAIKHVAVAPRRSVTGGRRRPVRDSVAEPSRVRPMEISIFHQENRSRRLTRPTKPLTLNHAQETSELRHTGGRWVLTLSVISEGPDESTPSSSGHSVIVSIRRE